MTASLIWPFIAFGLQTVAHADEPAASSPVDAPTEQSEEPAVEPEASSASEARTAVVVELSNGIKLTGTILTSDALYWEPGWSLSFLPEGGTTPHLLEAAKIKSVSTKVEYLQDCRQPRAWLQLTAP